MLFRSHIRFPVTIRGGYDASAGNRLLEDGETAFTLIFVAKSPQGEWGKSPLYTSRKFVGNEYAMDMNIGFTNGVAESFLADINVYLPVFISYPSLHHHWLSSFEFRQGIKIVKIKYALPCIQCILHDFPIQFLLSVRNFLSISSGDFTHP